MASSCTCIYLLPKSKQPFTKEGKCYQKVKEKKEKEIAFKCSYPIVNIERGEITDIY